VSLKLIVGLGNPGPEHTDTRHNAGFWFLDALAAKHGLVFAPDKKSHGDAARLNKGEIDCRLLKPMTYMNNSGRAVRAVSDYYGIKPEEVLIVHDEIDLETGTVRLKQGGGHGGHNGVRDIIEHLGNADFLRLRIGVAHPGVKKEVINHVLQRPGGEEKKLIDDAMQRALDVLPLVFSGELTKAMTQLNARSKPQELD
jgi:PTH1 family peptidyl-tRNA hydrolase